MNRESKTYKEEYLKNLQREIANIQTNERGNMNFKQFGTSTPNSLPDNRTGVEKMGDTQRVINEVKKGLLEIMEPDYMTVVVNDLQKNTKILEFVYAKMPYIQRKLREKYKKESLTPALFNEELDNFINKDIVGLMHDKLLPVQADVEAESGEINYEHQGDEGEESGGEEQAEEEYQEQDGSDMGDFEPIGITEEEEGDDQKYSGSQLTNLGRDIEHLQDQINEIMGDGGRMESILGDKSLDDLTDQEIQDMTELNEAIGRFLEAQQRDILDLNNKLLHNESITKSQLELSDIDRLKQINNTYDNENYRNNDAFKSMRKRLSAVIGRKQKQQPPPQEKLEAPASDSEEEEEEEGLYNPSLSDEEEEGLYNQSLNDEEEEEEEEGEHKLEPAYVQEPEPKKQDIEIKIQKLSDVVGSKNLQQAIARARKNPTATIEQKIELVERYKNALTKEGFADTSTKVKNANKEIEILRQEQKTNKSKTEPGFVPSSQKQQKGNPLFNISPKTSKKTHGSGLNKHIKEEIKQIEIKPIFNHDRFEILKGEIIAGNDSKDILKEFKKMLHDAVRKRLITHEELEEYLEEIDVN